MPPVPILTTNTLFYGDNLDILREHIATESVDLVYLDPPFNSNRNYNVLFKDESGHAAALVIVSRSSSHVLPLARSALVNFSTRVR
jgi:16S rRNA G966 N2-methylase RsmD